MAEHPPADLLDRFLGAALSPREAAPILRHLLAGCARCGARLKLAVVPQPWRHLVGEPTAGELEDYDGAIDRAVAAVRLHGRRAPRLRERARRLEEELAEHGLDSVRLDETDGVAMYEALLAESWSLRYSGEPQRMIDFAYFATRVAPNLATEGYSAQQVADFEARAWAALANAYRVAERFGQAETTVATAFRCFLRGTRDPLLEAWLLDVRAALLAVQGQYSLADQLLDRSYDLYLAHHERLKAARALVQKAFYNGLAGNTSQALAYVEQSLSMIDAQRDPELAAAAVQTHIDLLIDCRRFKDARTHLWRNRETLSAAGDTSRVKLQLLEGRINAGLGHLDRAERAFLAAHDGFIRAGARRNAAVVTLDLATLRMRQERIAEAHHLADEAIDSLAACGVPLPFDASIALVLLRSSFQAAMASVALLETVTDYLRRSEHNPTLRFHFTPP